MSKSSLLLSAVFSTAFAATASASEPQAVNTVEHTANDNGALQEIGRVKLPAPNEVSVISMRFEGEICLLSLNGAAQMELLVCRRIATHAFAPVAALPAPMPPAIVPTVTVPHVKAHPVAVMASSVPTLAQPVTPVAVLDDIAILRDLPAPVFEDIVSEVAVPAPVPVKTEEKVVRVSPKEKPAIKLTPKTPQP